MNFLRCGSTYSLLSGLCDVLVRLEKAADVHSLAAPDIAVDCPVEGKLKGPAVEGAGGASELCRARAMGPGGCSQDLGLGGHGWGWCWPSRPANGFRVETESSVSCFAKLSASGARTYGGCYAVHRPATHCRQRR